MHAAWVLSGVVHIRRKLSFTRTVPASRRVGPVIRVLNPTVRGIDRVWTVLDVVYPVPLGCGVAAVHRMGPVEPIVATGDELRVEVGDVAVRVGVHRVVRGV